jgi:hypothetical protein
VADASGLYFTAPHFDGYAIVLVELDRIPPDELEELVVDAWFARTPKRVAAPPPSLIRRTGTRHRNRSSSEGTFARSGVRWVPSSIAVVADRAGVVQSRAGR